MPDTPLYFHTITELAALIQSQQLSPVEVTRVLLERITQLDRRYKSYATVMADHALDAARVAEQSPGHFTSSITLPTISKLAIRPNSLASAAVRGKGL